MDCEEKLAEVYWRRAKNYIFRTLLRSCTGGPRTEAEGSGSKTSIFPEVLAACFLAIRHGYPRDDRKGPGYLQEEAGFLKGFCSRPEALLEKKMYAKGRGGGDRSIVKSTKNELPTEGEKKG